MPRPAVNKINVATIGWMLSFATKNPLKAPHNAEANSAATTPKASGAANASTDTFPPDNIWQQTAAATAITAPTLISCPPEAAVTNVMPPANITSSEARFTISTT